MASITTNIAAVAPSDSCCQNDFIKKLFVKRFLMMMKDVIVVPD